MTKLKIVFLIITLVILTPLLYLTFGESRPASKMTWGVSFSKGYAEYFGLDWKVVYLSILDELNASHLRLPAYWTEIEPEPGKFNFADLDFMIEQARLRDRKVILVVGRRLPRWPECHVPDWAKNLSLEEQDNLVFEQLKRVIERYRNLDLITAWQVENEYFHTRFGVCPSPNQEFFKKEIALVKSLNNTRQVVVTDSGEFSLWFKTAMFGDVFGTTMYRRGYNAVFGPADWPHPPVYYSRLGELVQKITGVDRIVISELQMEPWARRSLADDPTEVNFETFDPDQFGKNLRFARNSGLDEAYLWGAEWWYYMKEVRGVDIYWNQAREIWQPHPSSP